MKGSKKKKRLIISAVAMLVTTVVIFSAQTVAYFTDSSDPNYVVALAGSHLSGELIETTVPSEGGDPVLGPTSVRIRPGATVKKSVAVKNTGDLDMYLRLKIDVAFALSAENAGALGDPTLVEYSVNETDWELRDGFYYYKHPLSPGEITPTLFDEIKFSSRMDNTYTNSSTTFHITAYATQVAGNGVTVFEAQGWPGVQGEGGGA